MILCYRAFVLHSRMGVCIGMCEGSSARKNDVRRPAVTTACRNMFLLSLALKFTVQYQIIQHCSSTPRYTMAMKQYSILLYSNLLCTVLLHYRTYEHMNRGTVFHILVLGKNGLILIDTL